MHGGAHRTLCPRCARASPPLFPIIPDGQGDRSNHRVPIRRTAQILTRSKNSDNELNQPIFPTKNARLPSESAGFAPWAYAPPVAGGFPGGSRKRYRTAPPPPCVNTGLSKHGDPVFPHFWSFFFNRRFCGSDPIENVVYSFVQDAGRVNMGDKVWLQL